MTVTTTNGTTTQTTTPPKGYRGFPGCGCIKCGETGALVTLDLDDLNTFRCGDCEEEFTLDDAREYVQRAKVWAKIVAWVEAAPVQ